MESLAKNPPGRRTVLEAGNDSVVVTYPDELLHDAVIKMLRNNIGRLPVVDRREPTRLAGYLGRSAMMEARLQRVEEEHLLEPGWLKTTARRNPLSRNHRATSAHGRKPTPDEKAP